MADLQKRLVPERTLRLIFLVMAAWDLLGGAIQLIFDSFLFRLKDGTVPAGILAGRAFSGALFVTGALYLIAAMRPTRYRFIIWLAVFEQLAATCTGVFHGAKGNLSWGGVVLPVGVAIALLVLLLLNYPRFLPEEAPPEMEGEGEGGISGGEGPPGEE